MVGAAAAPDELRPLALVRDPRRRRTRRRRTQRGAPARRLRRRDRRAPRMAGPGLGTRPSPGELPPVPPARPEPRDARCGLRQRQRRDATLRGRRHARRAGGRGLGEEPHVSLLRARCPTCRALTAVAVDEGYECHSCGRAFAAGLVRVPRAGGDGGEAMVEAAALPLAFPEVAVVEEETLAMQTLAVASDLPARPLVLGGCCCSHLGAVEGLAARHGRVAVLWLDAHGDLNTPATSPSGNEWGMPLRTLLDRGTIDAADVALWRARN